MKTNKLIRWVEIPAENFERAVEFYNSVFDWEMEPMDWGTEKMACLPNDEGAISFAPGFKPSKNGVLVSLNSDDLEETLAKVKANGGSVVQPKTKIEAEGRGYFATFYDSEGNKIGLYGEK